MRDIKKQRTWKAKQRMYYKENRDAWNEYQKEYKKKRYREDAAYRARMKEYGRQYRLKVKNDENR